MATKGTSRLQETFQDEERVVSINWIDFKDTKLVTSAILRAYKILKGEGEYKKLQEDDTKVIYDFSWNFLLLEYSSSQERDADRALFKEHFKPTQHFAQVETDGYQVPQVDFYVDDHGKSYVLIQAHLKLTDVTDVQKGIYRGVIVDPKKYFQVPQAVSDTKGKVTEVV